MTDPGRKEYVDNLIKGLVATTSKDLNLAAMDLSGANIDIQSGDYIRALSILGHAITNIGKVINNLSGIIERQERG